MIDVCGHKEQRRCNESLRLIYRSWWRVQTLAGMDRHVRQVSRQNHHHLSLPPPSSCASAWTNTEPQPPTQPPTQPPQHRQPKQPQQQNNNTTTTQQHWPASSFEFGVGGVSFVELLILYEQWAGERLCLEAAIPKSRRVGRPISVSAVPFGPGIDIWRSLVDL